MNILNQKLLWFKMFHIFILQKCILLMLITAFPSRCNAHLTIIVVLFSWIKSLSGIIFLKQIVVFVLISMETHGA